MFIMHIEHGCALTIFQQSCSREPLDKKKIQYTLSQCIKNGEPKKLDNFNQTTRFVAEGVSERNTKELHIFPL